MTAKEGLTAPTQAEVDAILGDGAGLLEIFLGRNPELRPEWKYYGAKNGWVLKAFRGKRNMCFVGHEPGAIAIVFILGERAFERLLKTDLRPEVKAAVEAAKRFPEGRSIRLILEDESNIADVQQVLDIKRTT